MQGCLESFYSVLGKNDASLHKAVCLINYTNQQRLDGRVTRNLHVKIQANVLPLLCLHCFSLPGEVGHGRSPCV